ncbi:MAG: daptide-type RiPP biosynthesis aminotransferase [Dermatophilaceae bacterium]
MTSVPVRPVRSAERRGGLWPALLPLSAAGDPSATVETTWEHRIRFADGRVVLCGTSGLWNTNLGYGNEAIAASVFEALRSNSYAGVFRYENPAARAAAQALLDAAGPAYERVIFSVSGGSANDLVMKLVRQYHQITADPGRNLIVGLRGSYHGLTFGAHALSGEELGQRSYGVDQQLVVHVPPNDPQALRTVMRLAGRRVAAVVVEPVLGTGAVPLTEDYLDTLLRLRGEHGYLVVADEVATGFGRTGSYFASDGWSSPPDVLVCSKALTNGTLPASAVLTGARVARTFHESGAVLVHAETQAGSAVTSAAILATLQEMQRLDAVTAGRRVARRLQSGLHELLEREPAVRSVRGVGCMWALEIGSESDPMPQQGVPELVRMVRAAGANTHPGPHGIQLLPALTYTDAEVDELLECVRNGLRQFAFRHSRAVS